MHIGMAASVWGAASLAGPAGQTESTVSALQKEAGARMALMLAGIRKYQNHPYARDFEPLPVVWQAGTARLLKGEGGGAGAPLLIVPSMINGSEILDLVPERSFVRWMAARGRTVYLLDWGAIAQDPEMQNLEAVLRNRMLPAMQYIAQHECGGPVHLAGYCMGGLLALMLAGAAPESFRSMLLLATPWDFHAGSLSLINRVRFWAPAALQAMERSGVLSADSIQALFASVDPLLAARKFLRFAGMDEGSAEARVFVAAEDWLDEGVDLPAGIAHACIREWYLENRTGRGLFDLIPAEHINIPALVMAARRDRLVPYESAAALAGILPRAALAGPDCGHIGMMAGRRAVGQVWEPAQAWLTEHDARADADAAAH